MKEQCEHCHNMVVGQFSPSDTRKWLTALAKKGGMKAVLSAAGSVIPGFGTVSGFIAGTAIDVIYGKDINKLVDKVADAFDDNKIYVFTCPNCGHTWTRHEDELMYYNELVDESEEDEDEDEEYEDEEYEDEEYEDEEYEDEDEYDDIPDQFDQSLSYLLENVGQITRSAETTRNFMCKMIKSSKHASEKGEAAFYFLAALAGLLSLRNGNLYENEYRKMSRDTHSHIKQAISLYASNEYRLIETLLIIQTSSDTDEIAKYIRKAVACKIDDDYSWLTKKYYQKSLVPDVCFFKVHDIDINDAISNDDKIALWKLLVNSPVKDYRMYANLQIFRELPESDEEAYRYLQEAFKTKGFSLRNPNLDDVMYKQWLYAAVNYARCLCTGDCKNIAKDNHLGMDMLHTIADLSTDNPCLFARYVLGEFAEKDGNLQQALTYYIKAGEWGSEDAIRIRKMMSEVSNKEKSCPANSNISEIENEYLSEVKLCLEEDGEITNGERRLLNKLRIKLGISEERANELEKSLQQPQLTEDEEEYLNLYRECLAEGGNISAGERRLLDRMRMKLGISEKRAKELENL